MICNLMEFVTLPLDFPVYFFLIKMANSDGEAHANVRNSENKNDGLIMYVSRGQKFGQETLNEPVMLMLFHCFSLWGM